MTRHRTRAHTEKVGTTPTDAATTAWAGPEADPSLVIGGANPFVGMTIGQIAAAVLRWSAGLARHPTVLTADVFQWAAEQVKIVAGASSTAPDPKDKRFADAAWQHPVWRRVAQSYLNGRTMLLDSVDDLGLDDKSAHRARFALSQLTEAMAPTNVLAGNPAALKRALRTRGRSLVAGGRHMLYDLRHNRAMPSQVDTRPFRVGETIAVSAGAVVHRTPMFELIQYTPTTADVYAKPTVIVPPQINRYYFLDLAPGRSFVEHSVGQGIQTFMISWRNPGPNERDWALDDYAAACIEAMTTAAQICGSDQVNVAGFCAGGMTMSAVLAHLQATGSPLVDGAALVVTMLDTDVSSTLNIFATQRTVSTAIRRSRRKGILDGQSLARVFAWVRPTDLVWSFWVNNYLLGENPPSFDVLAWNKDATNLPASLHAEFLHLWLDNSLMRPGTLEVLGTPVDLGQVDNDLYVVGAMTDHLVPWQSAYGATRAFGSKARFVLSNSGHIQALINPPGNPKATYIAGDGDAPTATAWLDSATREAGSWWTDWAAWTIAHSGQLRPKPTALGDAAHEILEIAPGRYVRE